MNCNLTDHTCVACSRGLNQTFYQTCILGATLFILFLNPCIFFSLSQSQFFFSLLSKLFFQLIPRHSRGVDNIQRSNLCSHSLFSHLQPNYCNLLLLSLIHKITSTFSKFTLPTLISQRSIPSPNIIFTFILNCSLMYQLRSNQHLNFYNIIYSY